MFIQFWDGGGQVGIAGSDGHVIGPTNVHAANVLGDVSPHVGHVTFDISGFVGCVTGDMSGHFGQLLFDISGHVKGHSIIGGHLSFGINVVGGGLILHGGQIDRGHRLYWGLVCMSFIFSKIKLINGKKFSKSPGSKPNAAWSASWLLCNICFIRLSSITIAQGSLNHKRTLNAHHPLAVVGQQKNFLPENLR